MKHPTETLDEFRRKRLIELIDTHFDKTQALLAEKLGLANSTLISHYVTGTKRITEKTTLKMESVTGLHGWFNFHNASNFEPAPAPRGQIPLISWVKAGEFCEAIDLLQPGDAEDWITTTVQPRAYTYALRIRGDSMEPTFPDGAIIVVEPEMEPKHGSYVIAKNGNNEATFKQLVQDGGVFYLKPLNPRYPLMPVDTNTCFCGVVREMVMRFD